MQTKNDKDWFDFKRLEIFLQIAAAGSFSRASSILAISQPALSRYIRALEVALGSPVFYRDGRGVQLTEAGKRLQARGKAIMDEVAIARNEMANLENGPATRVVVAVQAGASSLLTVPLALRALADLPKARVHIMEGLSGHILEWLAEGQIDIALHYDQPSLSRLNTEPVLSQDLLLVGPSHVGLSLQKTVPALHLAKVPLILPGRPHGLRATLDSLASKKGFTLTVPIEVDSGASIINLVARGMGYTVLPLTLVIDAYCAGRISASWIAKPRATRTLLMTTATHRPFTPAAKRMMQIIRQEARKVSSESRELPGQAPDD